MPFFTVEHISQHKSEDLFDIVADIESYPEYLPACQNAQILERHPNYLLAQLIIGYGPLHETFISRVYLDRERGIIDVELEEGPLHDLECRWSFTQKGEDCQTVCALDFDFQRGFLARFATPLLDRAIQLMMDSFIKRAG